MWPVRAVVGTWPVGCTRAPPGLHALSMYRLTVPSPAASWKEDVGRDPGSAHVAASVREQVLSVLTEEGLPAVWGGQLRLQGVRTFRSRETAPRPTASVWGGRRSRCPLRDFRIFMGLNGQGELPPCLWRGLRWWFACAAGPSVRGAEQRQGAAGWGCTVFSCQERSEAQGPRGGTSSAIAPGLAVPCPPDHPSVLQRDSAHSLLPQLPLASLPLLCRGQPGSRASRCPLGQACGGVCPGHLAAPQPHRPWDPPAGPRATPTSPHPPHITQGSVLQSLWGRPGPPPFRKADLKVPWGPVSLRRDPGPDSRGGNHLTQHPPCSGPSAPGPTAHPGPVRPRAR